MLGYILGIIIVITVVAVCGIIGYEIDIDYRRETALTGAFWFGLPLAFLVAGGINDCVEIGGRGVLIAMITIAVVIIILGLLSEEQDKDFHRATTILSLLSIAVFCLGSIKVIERENIVLLPEPEIVETRHDILGGGDSSRVSGYVSGTLLRTRGEVGEGDNFKLYYEEERNGEYIAVPMLIPENKTTVVLMKENSVEHVIKIEKIFYLEDRNVDPYEVSVDHVEVSYKLYVNEATFTGLQFDGN